MEPAATGPAPASAGPPCRVASPPREELSATSGPARGRELRILFFVLFNAMVAFGIVIPTLPFLALALGISPAGIGVVTSVYALAQFAGSPFWGTLSDRYGRKPVLAVGMAGLGLSFLWMGLARSYGSLVLARAVGGVLAAAAIPTAQAFAADISTPEERGRAMGLMGAALSLGFLFGPAIGGLLTPLGIRVPFLVGGGVAVVAAALAAAVLGEPARREAGPPAGATAGLAALRRALEGGMAPLYVATGALMFSNSILFTLLPLFLTDRTGATPRAAGMAFTVNGLVSALCQLALLGPALARWGEGRTVRRALLVGAAGFLVLAAARSLAAAFLSLVAVACGSSLARPVLTTLASRRSPGGQGTTMGVQTAFDSLGRTVGPLWAGYAYGLHGEVPFWTAAVMNVAAAFALLGGRVRERARQRGVQESTGGRAAGGWASPPARAPVEGPAAKGCPSPRRPGA